MDHDGPVSARPASVDHRLGVVPTGWGWNGLSGRRRVSLLEHSQERFDRRGVEVIPPRRDPAIPQFEDAHHRQRDVNVAGEEVVDPLGHDDVAGGHEGQDVEVQRVVPRQDPGEQFSNLVGPGNGGPGHVVVDGVRREVSDELVRVESLPGPEEGANNCLVLSLV
jgi:hypothetical protein